MCVLFRITFVSCTLTIPCKTGSQMRLLSHGKCHIQTLLNKRYSWNKCFLLTFTHTCSELFVTLANCPVNDWLLHPRPHVVNQALLQTVHVSYWRMIYFLLRATPKSCNPLGSASNPYCFGGQSLLPIKYSISRAGIATVSRAWWAGALSCLYQSINQSLLYAQRRNQK